MSTIEIELRNKAIIHAWCDRCPSWLFSAPPADISHLRLQVNQHAETGHAPVLVAELKCCGDQTDQRHVLSQVITDATTHECGQPR